ncbi:MAG: hypothetical protein ACYTHM_03490, partial [Planctomycetota bacterium]
MEEFALAENREQVLEQLIPGTEDHYYYHCLHHQHERRFDEVEKLLKLWKQRHGSTSQWEEVRHRQALLTYDQTPDKTLQFIRRELGPTLSHQQEIEGKVTDFPSQLDPAIIEREAYKAEALSRSSGVDEFTDRALEWLVPKDLDNDRRRSLLERLHRPDFPNLVTLILEDLDYEYSSGFGSMTIHRNLLPDQLEELARRKPDLMTETEFIHAWITKLQPNPDGDWKNDPEEREAYLDVLWGFVRGLAPAFNTLKAHILYHRLLHDRSLGRYDRTRFMEYVTLPRNASYVEPKYIRRRDLRDFVADLHQDFSHVTLLELVGDDEPLVRDYLEHFFVEEEFEGYKTYIRDTYLKEVFAVTRLLTGTGDMEKGYALLNDPAKVQALKDRVDLDFAHTNRTRFRPDEEVSLDVHVKNVETLMVKVFEINTLNYFLARGAEVDTSVDLDGLVAAEEQTHEYKEPPIRRVRRTFTFPSLKKPGVFVVEFIGGGRSSRALIRKGRLRILERVGAAGHVFTILDEENRVLSDATLWLAGHEYRPGKDGTITVPFTTNPGLQKILLRHGEQTSLETFHHAAEAATFSAGFYVDRENLLKRQHAQILVRPTLRIHGTPVPLSLLENVRLIIESTDRYQVSAKKEVPDLPLPADGECTYTFQVPEDLSAIALTLTAEVKILSANDKITVSDRREMFLNQIDSTPAVDDMHLSRAADGYALHLLGKSGEARPDKPIHFRFRHRGFTFDRDSVLQTDAGGRIALGDLSEIVSLTAVSPTGATKEWPLSGDAFQVPGTLHAREGEAISLPEVQTPVLQEKGKGGKKGPAGAKKGESPYSLLEKRGGTYVRNALTCLAVKDGAILLEGLTVGDYELFLKEQDARIELRVTAGERHREWILGKNRHLETRNRHPLQIDRVSVGKDEIRIHVANASKDSRIHAIGTRFLPPLSLYYALRLRGRRGLRLRETVRAVSDYVSGRDIGDEYRYILERKHAVKFPGNMLSRPGLLLNPWAVRKTETGLEEARPGTAYAKAAAPMAAPCAEAPADFTEGEADMSAYANLDFLAHASAVFPNLRPDENGEIVLERKNFAHASELHLLAVDRLNTVLRRVPLEPASTPHKDIRLRVGLDPAKHFTEKKQVSVLEAGGALTIADITTSGLETYDTLNKVYNLYATLCGGEHFQSFGFVLRWPQMAKEEKNRLYSEFACHELHFFLSRKDPEYFRSVISPYLRNKKDKTFMDRYLLEEDLSAYFKPWAFGRLNAVERILLCQRVKGAFASGKRHAEDRFDLLPVDIDRRNQLFDTALKGSALETEDALGMEAMSAQVMASMEERSMDLGAMRGAGAMEMKKARRASRPPSKKEKADDLMDAMEMEEEICDEDLADYDEYGEEEDADLDARDRLR